MLVKAWPVGADEGLGTIYVYIYIYTYIYIYVGFRATLFGFKVWDVSGPCTAPINSKRLCARSIASCCPDMQPFLTLRP